MTVMDRSAASLGLSPADTTVADELALVIGTLTVAGLDANRIADALVRTGWTNPQFAYLAELPLARESR